MELHVPLFPSESENSYRTFLVASGTMTLNFSCDVAVFRINTFTIYVICSIRYLNLKSFSATFKI